LDDALQAPINHKHFDLYAQGPTTGNKYKSLEHIPGLNIGGWFDAGDYDIRTQTQCAVVQNLAQTWEMFSPNRDETYINQKNRYVDLHHPDGLPDIIQQIEHGTLALIAQHRAVGYAINGIIEAHLSQYTHLGDASTITDNLIYDPKLDSLQTDGYTSGTFDDRWTFTNKSTPLNYSSAASLAAASRILHGYNNSLAEECFLTSQKIWDEEHTHAPDLFRSGNTTGGQLDAEEFNAALELFICTKDKKYEKRINDLLPSLEKQFSSSASLLAAATHYMGEEYKSKVELLTKKYKEGINKLLEQNPFGVPITTGGWAGNGAVVNFAKVNYLLHKIFPEIIDKEYCLRGMNFIFGCHPGSNVSLVSSVGTHSKRIAYGNNRADFSFIAGGVVPGMLILKPDFPENKEDWPFLWGENEYVVNLCASYIFMGNAVNDLFTNK
jgi:endoglucanase